MPHFALAMISDDYPCASIIVTSATLYNHKQIYRKDVTPAIRVTNIMILYKNVKMALAGA